MMRQILNWLRRGKLESGLDRELEYHLDRRVCDLVRSGAIIGKLSAIRDKSGAIRVRPGAIIGFFHL